jgi:hypothetical protein
MTGADHQHSDTVLMAAQWLAQQQQPPRPIIPHLRQRFGLSALEACEACGLASSVRVACRAA